MAEEDVIEDWKNLGAISASATAGFNLKDKATFPYASGLFVHTLVFINDSRANPTIWINGRRFQLKKGRSGDLTLGPKVRIEQFEVRNDGTAIADKELQVIAKGVLLPYNRAV